MRGDGAVFGERERSGSAYSTYSASSLHSTLSSFGGRLGGSRRVGVREEAELRLRGVLAAQAALGAALAARRAALTSRLRAVEAQSVQLQRDVLSGGARRRAPPPPGASPLRGGDAASQASFLAEVRARAAAAHAAASEAADSALKARLRAAAAEGVEARLRESHPTTATKLLRRRLEADAAAAISCRMSVERYRRERTQLDRAALLQQQACVVEREMHAAAAAEAQRAAERNAAKSLRLRCDRARARSVLYVLGAPGPSGVGGMPVVSSPAQAHAQDAADAAREALEALRALRS